MNQNYCVYKLVGDQPTKIAGNTWKAHTNNSDIVAFYADIDTAKVIYAHFIYEKDFNSDNISNPPLKYMGMAQDSLIDTIIPNGYVEDGYHLWIYSLPNSITGINGSGSNVAVRVSFNIRELEQPDEYLGNITTDNTSDSAINAELKVLYPSATTDDYVNVHQNVANEFNSWEFDGTDFIKQTDPDVLNQLTENETLYYQDTIRPNSASQSEVTDRDITDEHGADIAQNRTDIDAITGVQAGLMDKATYDVDDNGVVDKAEALDNGDGSRTIVDDGTKWVSDAPIKADEFIVGTRSLTNNTVEETLDLEINTNVTLQVGRELLKLGRNETGATITNGSVIAIIGATGNVAKIELLDITDYDQSFKVIGIATEDILNNATGNVTLIGRVRGLDTSSWAEGTILYAGIGGTLTDVKPTEPNRCVLMAVVETSNAGAGILWTWPRPLPALEEISNVYIPSPIDEGMIRYNATNSRYELVNPEEYLMSRDIQNGAFKESFDFRYNATTSLMELTKNANDPSYGTAPNTLTEQFSDGDSELDVTSCTCAPTFGTATVPAHNYFYILQSNKGVIVSSTTGWPTTEHNKLAEVVFLDEVTTDADGGPLRNQNINNHEKNTNSIGALNDIRERIRALGAQWRSGIDGATTGDYVNGTLHWTSTAGIVYQMHQQTFDAKDTSAGDDIHVVNDFTAPYKTINTFDEITEFSDGTTIGNAYYNIFIWASINKTGEYDGIFANIPTGGYISLSNALEDPDAKTVTTVPVAFRDTAFSIARLVFRKQGATFTFQQQIDLRDARFGVSGVSGGTGSDNEFTDNLFRVNNVTDGTKQLAFDISGVSTATTRTVSIPDEDVDLAKVNSAVQKDLTEYSNLTVIKGSERLYVDDLGTPKNNTIDEIATYIGNLSNSTLNTGDYDDKGLGAFKTGFHTVYEPTNTVDADLVLNIFDTTDITASAEIQNFFTTGGVNKFMYIKVPDTLNDDTQGVTLTLDNGANTHNINVGTQNVIGSTVLGKVLKIEYTYDTSGAWEYVQQEIIINQSTPYTRQTDVFTNPKNEIYLPINEDTVGQPDNIFGAPQLPQIIDGGDASTNITSDNNGSQVTLETNGTWDIVANTYQPTKQLFNIVSGTSYYVKVIIDSGSVGDLSTAFKFRYSDNTNENATFTKVGNTYKGLITATKSLLANLFLTEGTAGLVTRVHQMLIPLPPSITTVAEAEQYLDGRYYEGLNWYGKSRIYTPSEYSQSIQNYFAEKGVETGDTINGSFIETVDKNKFDRLLDNVNITLVNDDDRNAYNLTNFSALKLVELTDIDFIPETQYTLQFDYKSVEDTYTGRFGFLYDDGTGEEFALGSTVWASATSTSAVGKTVIGLTITNFSSGGENLRIDRDTIQIELGTTATEYETYKNSLVYVNGELLSDRDNLLEQTDIMDMTILKSSSITLGQSGTNTNEYRANIYSQLLWKVVANNVAGNVWLEIVDSVGDTILLLPETANNIFSNDNPNKVATAGTAYLSFRLDNTDYPTASSVETLLTNAQSVKLTYELATAIPRAYETGNVIELDGTMLIGKDNTFTQDSNGVIGTFYATSAINAKALSQANTGAIIDTNDKVVSLDNRLDKLENEVGTVADLDTTNKEVVGAINEEKARLDDVKTKTDFITVTQAVDLDTIESDLDTAKTDISNIETKTDFISVSENVNLDKVSEYTLLWSTGLDVPTATTKPLSNITLSESLANFDLIEIHTRVGTTRANVIHRLDFTANNEIARFVVDSDITTTSKIEYFIRIDRDSTTTLTAYYAGQISYTYSTNAIAYTISSTIDIVKIYGIKY